jgi:hypothetical protein
MLLTIILSYVATAFNVMPLQILTTSHMSPSESHSESITHTKKSSKKSSSHYDYEEDNIDSTATTTTYHSTATTTTYHSTVTASTSTASTSTASTESTESTESTATGTVIFGFVENESDSYTTTINAEDSLASENDSERDGKKSTTPLIAGVTAGLCLTLIIGMMYRRKKNGDIDNVDLDLGVDSIVLPSVSDSQGYLVPVPSIRDVNYNAIEPEQCDYQRASVFIDYEDDDAYYEMAGECASEVIYDEAGEFENEVNSSLYALAFSSSPTNVLDPEYELASK